MKHIGLTFDGRIGLYYCNGCGKNWDKGDDSPECLVGNGRAKFLQLKQELVSGGKTKPDSGCEAIEGDTV